MKLAAIWRHPIKAHGREAVESAEIEAGGTIPRDRLWAVAHEAARLPDATSGSAAGSPWAACVNFNRGAKTPALMAIEARSEPDGTLTLTHPDRPDLSFDPDGDNRPFLDWIAPISDPSRAAPSHILRAAGRGFTDTNFASISLANFATHAEVEARTGRALSPHRWRGNLWIEGAAPWAEFDWIGRELTLGTARFHAAERITRCRATMANPETGRIDADTLGALESGWGHRDFGIYLTCVAGGQIAIGDELALA